MASFRHFRWLKLELQKRYRQYCKDFLAIVVYAFISFARKFRSAYPIAGIWGDWSVHASSSYVPFITVWAF